MAEKSGVTNLLLIIIAVILVLGVYWGISAIDNLRLRQESMIREMQGINSQLERMASAPTQAEQAPLSGKQEAKQPRQVPFANAETRDPNAVEGDAVVRVLADEPGNLNYVISSDAIVAMFNNELCQDSPAVRNFANPDVFEPMLANSWEISDDKLVYTIHLRKGVYWHDVTDPTTKQRFENVPVTANDFKFAIDVIKNPGIQCDPIRTYYEDLDRLEVVDDYTFKVYWKKKYFLSEESTLTMNPLPRHFYKFNPAKPDEFNENTERNRMIVGCGPWIFEKWDKGKEITFRRNENYYGPKPYLKRMVFRVITEPNARLQAFMNGEIDRVGLTPAQWFSDAATPEFEKKYFKADYFAVSYSFMGWNMRKPMFADKLTRQALTYLVNRPRMLKEVERDMAVEVSGPFYIESSSYDKSVEPYPFDVDKAKALLAQAGWKDTDGDGVLDRDGKRFEFTFMIPTASRETQRIAEIVRDDFAKAGIVVNINPLEWSVYSERLDYKNFDVCILRWVLSWDQDPYQLWHSSQADLDKSSNFISFKNKEADRLIEEARVEFDKDKRNALYHQFHRLLADEQPYTFLFTPKALMAQDRRFRNTTIYPYVYNDSGMYVGGFWVPKAEQKYKE